MPSAPTLNAAELRGAIQLRWRNDDYRQRATALIKRLAATPSKDRASGTRHPSLDGGGADKSGSSSATRRLSLLEQTVLDAVSDVRNSLPDKPWSDTIKFVTFDLPLTGEQFIGWAQAFVDESENDERVRTRITNLVPGMKNHPDTAQYMGEIILPFRSFLIAQVVAYVLEDVDTMPSGSNSAASSGRGSDEIKQKKGGNKKGQPGKKEEASTSRAEAVGSSSEEQLNPLSGRKRKLFPCHVHAAHHAKDVDDVLYIDSLVPNDQAELGKHIKSMGDQKIVTRYAEYNNIYLTTGEDVDDNEWYKLMLPLAKSGLAHAQFDVGMCCLSLKREEEGIAWLERASKLGHSRAMLELGKLFLQRAMTSNRFKKTDVVKAKTDDNVKKSLAILDTLCDAEWDKGTAQDVSEGKKILDVLEHEAKVMKAQHEQRQKESSNNNARRFMLHFTLASVMLLAAMVYGDVGGIGNALGMGGSGKAAEAEVEEPTHINTKIKRMVK